MPVLMSYLLVAIGGGIGAALRHGVNRVALVLFSSAFPYGTLLVNLLGAFLMGMIAQYLLGRDVDTEGWRLFLVTGVLGGFTTFSAFTLEVGMMWQRSEYAALCIYMTASVLLSVLLLVAGMLVGRAIT
jgi:CrcB protein